MSSKEPRNIVILCYTMFTRFNGRMMKKNALIFPLSNLAKETSFWLFILELQIINSL